MPPKSARSKNSQIKILTKCSWSGARIPSPSTFPPSATLSQIISSISSSLPPVITNPLGEDMADDPQPFIVYMRTKVLKRDWGVTRLCDFCDGSSVLLTLNLPKDNDAIAPAVESIAISGITEPMDIDEDVNVNTNANVNVVDNTTVASPSSSPLPSPATLVQNAQLAASRSHLSPGANDTHTNNHTNQQNMTPKKAMQRLVNQNFDQDSQECLTTILKILNNILTRSDAKFRSIRITNQAIHKKIISKKGGLDILLAIGFEYDSPPEKMGFDFDNSNARQREATATATSIQQMETIILRPENEDNDLLLNSRIDLMNVMTKDLKISPRDLPSTPRSIGGARGTIPVAVAPVPASVPFDPFKSQSFNTQAAAVGAPNPNSIVPDGTTGKTSTERQLEILQKKQQTLEQSIQSLDDRCITAFSPGEVGPLVSIRDPVSGVESSRKGDSSLIAQQMMKKMEDRKKREEGGFTTKSMRDLEKMKKAKVYSHAKLKICFPDGSYIEAKFLPSETISVVKSIVISTFVPEHSTAFQFDLYISPPRRILKDMKSLRDEGLVPAAKIFVSWKNGASPTSISPPGSYLQRHFFQNATISRGNEAFPASVGLTDSNSDAKKRSSSKGEGPGADAASGSAADKSSREEELMQRMLGKRKGLMGFGKGKRSGNSNTKDSKGPGKPKWLK